MTDTSREVEGAERPDGAGVDVELDRARAEDLATIVGLLAADPLGATREQATDPLPRAYLEAFGAIDKDPHQELVVARVGDHVVGVLQLSFLPSLTYRGSWRAQIEGVRVDRSYRSRGVGRRLIEHAVGLAAGRGCRLVQLTTDKERPRAIAFYEGLGFVPSHVGMKLHLTPGEPTDE